MTIGPPSSLLGIGLYTTAEAARLLKSRPTSVRRWAAGYRHKGRDGALHEVPPLWRPEVGTIEDDVILGFRDLVELRFVRAFLTQGIGLLAIRNCIAYARDVVGSDRPFQTGRFRTDGRTIFLQSAEAAGEAKLLDLKRRQYVLGRVIEQSFRDLDIEDEAVARWRPYRGKPSIVIDPERAFGAPVADASGVPVRTLAVAVEAEGSVQAAARVYDVDPAVVRDALHYSEELDAA